MYLLFMVFICVFNKIENMYDEISKPINFYSNKNFKTLKTK